MKDSQTLPQTSLTALLLLLFMTIPWTDAFAQEYQRAQVSDDGPYVFWRDRFIAYELDIDGSPDTDIGQTRAAVVRSFNTWESQPCTDIFFSFQGLTGGTEPNHFSRVADGHNVVSWLTEWPEEWGEGQLAQTSMVWNERTGEILDVDIVLNGQDYYWTTTTHTVTDIENVLTHEIGHFLGFAHTTAPDATMYDGYVEGETEKRDLAATDIRGLCEVYPAGRPTPDVPSLGLDESELSTGSCECSQSSRVSGSGLPLLILFVIVVIRRARSASSVEI